MFPTVPDYPWYTYLALGVLWLFGFGALVVLVILSVRSLALHPVRGRARPHLRHAVALGLAPGVCRQCALCLDARDQGGRAPR